MKKKIILCVTISLFMLITYSFAAGKKETSTGPTYTVANILNSNAKDIQKFIFKDIKAGIQKQNKEINIDQKFITYDAVDDSVFIKHDIVIIHSTGRSDTVEPEIIDFCIKYKENPHLIVTAYLPKNQSVLTDPPQEIDVISSASYEEPASALLIDTVSPVIVDIISKL